MIDWVIWFVLGLLVLFGVIAIVGLKRGKKHDVDYYSLFVMGITWLPLGIVFIVIGYSLGSLFFVLGLVFLVVGLSHRGEWKKHRTWRQLKGNEKKWKMAIIILLGLFLLIGVAVLYVTGKGVLG